MAQDSRPQQQQPEYKDGSTPEEAAARLPKLTIWKKGTPTEEIVAALNAQREAAAAPKE